MWNNLNDWAAQNNSIFKTFNLQITHCCEAPIYKLFNYFGKKQVFRGTFGEIWRIKIKIYPQTSIEPKVGPFYLTNEVSAHGLGLLVQLS